jgi:formyl-CoA transferase
VSIGDTLAATYGCLGDPGRSPTIGTGRVQGQIVDSALYESVLQVMESLVPEFVVSGHVRERSGPTLPGVAPSNVYRCADGEFLIAGQPGLGLRGGLPRHGTGPSWRRTRGNATHLERGRRQAELDALIEDWTQTRLSTS